ncbi:MAG: leucine-rich repeat domain-containing protein [Verrucomicrobia bacterium]|nr:leucine-rich repeat domain-containing protein [Verrucomicrobiota bacterium]
MNSSVFLGILVFLLSIFLTPRSEGDEPEWKLKELQRKERTQTVIGSLAGGTLEERHAATVELRDQLVRRRDMPDLLKEIDRNPSPEVKRSLQDLISLMKSGARLPTGGWTREDTREVYKRGFLNLGCSAMRESIMGYPTICISDALHIFDLPSEAKKQADVVGLILDLEPGGLTLCWEKWTNISFLGALPDIKGLNLFFTSVDDLTPLRGLNRLSLLELVDSPVSDLTPLKGLPSLRELKLNGTAVTDLAPLNGLKSLTKLHLEDTKVSDLTPVKGLPGLGELKLLNTEVTDLAPLIGLKSLTELHLERTKVIDLTPLKGLPSLRVLKLLNTEVTDLTTLKDLKSLTELHLESSKVIDLTPLKELPKLRRLYLQRPGGYDLTPLKGMPDLNISANTISQTNSSAASPANRFSTKPVDPVTGLYYYGYRWYDPLTGRRPSRDPIGEIGRINLYTFLNNSGPGVIDVLGNSGAVVYVDDPDDKEEDQSI